MEHAAGEDGWLLFFLWLIRVLFFTIELLPTVVKLLTPVGAYDIAIHQKENEIAKQLEKDLEDFEKNYQPLILVKYKKDLELAKRQENYRVQKEEENHKKIIDRIQKIQLKIAEDWLDRWENEVLAQPINSHSGSHTNGRSNGSSSTLSSPSSQNSSYEIIGEWNQVNGKNSGGKLIIDRTKKWFKLDENLEKLQEGNYKFNSQKNVLVLNKGTLNRILQVIYASNRKSYEVSWTNEGNTLYLSNRQNSSKPPLKFEKNNSIKVMPSNGL